MTISCKTRLILLIFIIQIPYLSIGSPYRFRRIACIEDNKVIKTIDLISDIHIRTHELVKKPSRKSKELQPKEKSAFTTAERTLLIALRKLAAQNKQIDLLWEATRTGESNILEVNNKDLREIQWLEYGSVLAKEFAPEQHKSVVFKNADTYRHNNPGEISINALLKANRKVAAHIPLSAALSFLHLDNYFSNPTLSKAMNDLESVKTHAFKSYYERLSDYWYRFRGINVQPVFAYFNQFLQANPAMTINDFHQQVRTIPEGITTAINNFPNAEFAIKSFASDSNHTIIYAGGHHCNNVVDLLTDQTIQTIYGKNFGCKLIIDLGIENIGFSDYSLTGFLSPVLIPKTWVYLAEDPKKSYNRYKSYGNKPFKNLVDKVLWQQFITLRDTLLNLPLAKATPAEDKNILAQLITFYKKASKTFIDFINVRDGARKTLLFYAVEKNLPTITEFLLKHTARVNTQDTAGNTPLHYASSDVITKLLHKHGAKDDTKNNAGITAKKSLSLKTTKPDAEGNTPLLIASKNGDFNGVQELLRFGVDIDEANNNGQTALISAVIGNHILIIQMLLNAKQLYHLSANADVDKTDNTGKTALHYAAINDYDDIISILLLQKADANKEDDQGFTPLLYAAQNNHPNTIKLLIYSTDIAKTLQKARECCPEAPQRIEDVFLSVRRRK